MAIDGAFNGVTTRLRSWGVKLVPLVLWATTSSCSQLLRTPVTAKAGAWVIHVKGVRDDPDIFGDGMGAIVMAGSDAHFLWVTLTLSNTTAEKRRWTWSKCDLDGPRGTIVPTAVAYRSTMLGREALIEPGAIITRDLVFGYPDGLRPSRLQCGDMSLALNLEL